jgi:DNA-binding transcriptional LysR family regulator
MPSRRPASLATAGPLPYLDTFARAAESGCFTTAARALGLTQAAVSQRVGALERALGVPLFRRQGGRVLLTDAGRRLHGYAQRILTLHDAARQEVTGRKAPVAGELTLAASSVPGEHLLPAALPAFRRKHPHVKVRVTVTDSQEVLEEVSRGKAHLGLVGGKADRPHLEFRPFACDRMALVVPAGHALARRKRVSLAELLRQPLILREPGSGSRWCLERALTQAGRSAADLQVVLEMGSNEAIKEAVLRGLGLAVLSTHVVEKELRSGRLHGLRVTGLPLERDMYLVWDRRRALPIPARLFLDFLAPCPHAEQS